MASKHVLFTAVATPNPRRVLIAAAELGVEDNFDVKVIDLGKVKSKEILIMNPQGQVPILKTADGLCISESIAITRFLEDCHNDGSQPGGVRPSLFGGSDPVQRALVEQWNRRVDIVLFMGGVGRVWIHNPLLRGLVKKNGLRQTLAEREFGQKICESQFKILDAQLKLNNFVAGDKISVADISLICCLDFAIGLAGVVMNDGEFPNLEAWRKRITERPSVQSHPNPYVGIRFMAARGIDSVLSAARRVSTTITGDGHDKLHQGQRQQPLQQTIIKSATSSSSSL
jgi:glutathione S-transferase